MSANGEHEEPTWELFRELVWIDPFLEERAAQVKRKRESSEMSDDFYLDDSFNLNSSGSSRAAAAPIHQPSPHQQQQHYASMVQTNQIGQQQQHVQHLSATPSTSGAKMQLHSVLPSTSNNQVPIRQLRAGNLASSIGSSQATAILASNGATLMMQPTVGSLLAGPSGLHPQHHQLQQPLHQPISQHLNQIHHQVESQRLVNLNNITIPTDHALRQHYITDHRQKIFTIKYRVTPVLEKKRNILEKLLYASLKGIKDPVYIKSMLAADNASDKDLTDPNESFNTLLNFDEVGCEEDVMALLNPSGSTIKNSLDESTHNYSNGYTEHISQANHVSNTDLSQNSLLLLNTTSDANHSQEFNKSTGLFSTNPLQLQEDFGKAGNEILVKLLGTASTSGSQEITRRMPVKRQFDESPPASQPPGQKRVSSQIACIDCGRQVSNYMNSLVLHVSTHHCEQPVYECLACHKQWFSLSARLKEHFRKHNNDLSLLKDNRSILSPFLKEKAAKLSYKNLATEVVIMQSTDTLPSNARMIWVDCEMTGLEIDKHKLVEIACIITEADLSFVAQFSPVAIRQKPEDIEGMTDWCKETFEKNGLLQRLKSDQAVDIQEVERNLLNFLQLHTNKNECPLAGNSVFMDKVFLCKYMPKVVDHLHYRIIDVSTVKEIIKRWYPAEQLGEIPQKKCNHLALDDIQESIEELRYYRKHFFKEQCA
uniref:Probable oligoribonuclease n=1 Tax=Ditylenchus dipsaci TaxID=166011 RepID=A0A915D033_9BILA